MKVGRPLEFDPDKALEAAMNVFWCQGYEATSMADLMKAMGLSKSSLYQSFGSKQDLYIRCIEWYGELSLQKSKDMLADSVSARSFISNIFSSSCDAAYNPHVERGCFVVNGLCEFNKGSAIFYDVLVQKTETLRKLFETSIRRAQDEGDISKDKNPEVLARYLQVSFNGLRVLMRQTSDEKVVKPVLKEILSVLD